MPTSAASPLDGCRVLLVEDTPADRFVYRTTLARAGAEVTAVTTGEATVAALVAGRKFDAAIVDLVLPDMRGTGVVVQVRMLGYRGALVGLSACLTSGVTERWLADGCDAVLPKERGLAEIVGTVANLCRTFDRA